jgi:hypothetical protein
LIANSPIMSATHHQVIRNRGGRSFGFSGAPDGCRT